MLISPDRLHMHHTWFDEVRVRMKNQTDDTDAQLFFRTDQEEEDRFSESKSFTFEIVPNDTQFRTYAIKKTDNEEANVRWQGYIEQLRLDVVHSATEGEVEIDWIHVYKDGKLVHR